MALGLGLLCWITLLFAPLAFVQTVQADDADNYGTVIGIVSIWTRCADGRRAGRDPFADHASRS